MTTRSLASGPEGPPIRGKGAENVAATLVV